VELDVVVTLLLEVDDVDEVIEGFVEEEVVELLVVAVLCVVLLEVVLLVVVGMVRVVLELVVVAVPPASQAPRYTLSIACTSSPANASTS